MNHLGEKWMVVLDERTLLAKHHVTRNIESIFQRQYIT